MLYFCGLDFAQLHQFEAEARELLLRLPLPSAMALNASAHERQLAVAQRGREQRGPHDPLPARLLDPPRARRHDGAQQRERELPLVPAYGSGPASGLDSGSDSGSGYG